MNVSRKILCGVFVSVVLFALAVLAWLSGLPAPVPKTHEPKRVEHAASLVQQPEPIKDRTRRKIRGNGSTAPPSTPQSEEEREREARPDARPRRGGDDSGAGERFAQGEAHPPARHRRRGGTGVGHVSASPVAATSLPGVVLYVQSAIWQGEIFLCTVLRRPSGYHPRRTAELRGQSRLSSARRRARLTWLNV